MKSLSKILLFILFLLPIGASASEINSGDTAWLLTSTALVLMMTIPGLFLFYVGKRMFLALSCIVSQQQLLLA